jgi:hypothetical protein
MSCSQLGRAGLLCCLALMPGLPTMAAGSLSNSLTGFTGDSNQPASIAALNAAGFNIFSTDGEIMGTDNNGTPDDPSDDFPIVVSNDTVTFDSNGIHIGSLLQGDGGRNYVRTNISDYIIGSFTAEITFENSDSQAVFIGVGAGDRALFGTPDWSTQFSSVSFWPETANDKFVRFRTQNDVNTFGDSNVAGFDAGTHRFRITYNAATQFMLGEIDLNYAGGPFVVDAASLNFPVVTTSLFAPDGWPSEPSRFFFGGDDGAVFRDLSITFVPEPATWLLLSVGLLMAGTRRGRKC